MPIYYGYPHLIVQKNHVSKPNKIQALLDSIAPFAAEGRSGLLPSLHLAQETYGWISEPTALAIGRALVGEPRLLLLDEPTEGIQPNIIQEIGRVLKYLTTEKDMTILLVEQYVDFIKEFGDRFYIMNRGRVVANGDTPQLSEDIVRQHLSV